jgi:hypothetical protein
VLTSAVRFGFLSQISYRTHSPPTSSAEGSDHPFEFPVNLAQSAAAPLSAHYRVPHYHEQIRQFRFRKVLNGVHDCIMALSTVRLPQAHDQNAVMRHEPVLREPLSVVMSTRASANAKAQILESATP